MTDQYTDRPHRSRLYKSSLPFHQPFAGHDSVLAEALANPAVARCYR